MRQRQLFFVYFLLIFATLHRGMDSCAEMRSTRHHDASHFASAWTSGLPNQSADPHLIRLFAWTYRRDDSTQPPVLWRFNRLEKQPEISWGALPEGSEYSNITAAHGRLWVYVQNEDGWSLFSAGMNAESAQWRPASSNINENIESFFLDSNADPLLILEKNGKWFVRTGGFTGGGEALRWDAMREISLFEKNQLTREAKKEDAARDMVGEFDLRSQAILLAFSCKENRRDAVKIRYRISAGKTRSYGPWSEPLPDSVIQLNQRGRYFQYQISSAPASGQDALTLPNLELIYTFDESEPQNEAKSVKSEGRPGKGGSSAGAGLGAAVGSSGLTAEAGAAGAAVLENAGDGMTSAGAGSESSDSPAKTGAADSGDPGASNSQDQTPAASPAQEENPSEIESDRQDDQQEASATLSGDSALQEEDFSQEDAKEKNPEEERSNQTENGASLQPPPNEPDADGDSSEASPESEPTDPQSVPDADPGQPESTPDADPRSPASSPSSNPPHSPQNQPLSQENPPDGGVADDEKIGAGRETNVESGLSDHEDQESSAPAMDNRNKAGKGKKTTAGQEKTTPSSGINETNESAGDAKEHNPTPPAANRDQLQTNREPASLSNASPQKGFTGANQPGVENTIPPGEEDGASNNGHANSSLSPSDFRDLPNSAGESLNSRPAAFASSGGASTNASRVKQASPEISEEGSGSSGTLEGTWKERNKSSWLLLVLIILAASYAAYRLMRQSRTKGAPVEVDVQNENWREGWIEDRQEQSGVWEAVLHFHPDVKAANLSGGVLLLMNQNHAVKKVSLPDLWFPKPAEEENNPTEAIVNLKAPIDSAQMAKYRNNLFVFGIDSHGQEKALHIALPAGEKAMKGRKISHPSGLQSIRSLKADGDILWALGEAPDGLRVLAASMGFLKGRAWREESPAALDKGEIIALSSGEETMIAGIPDKDRDHLWIFQQEKNRQGRWRAAVKTRFNQKNVLLYAARNRCVLIESTKEDASIGIHLFPRDEQGRFSTRAENHAPAPHAGKWLDLEIAGGCLYLLGRETSSDPESNSGRFCLLAARLGNLFQENQPKSK
ncbi:MAG: hypothetical protein JXR73_23685 [Candidatus Omnitrophica bacterium]|nr:hypothetical protein [Candidatus Omnitrophota bacterium]